MTNDPTTAMSRLLASIASRQQIVVDPQRLEALAASLHVAHNTLAASPDYAHLEAGDVDRRLAGTVSDFITKNKAPRERLVEQLEAAAEALDAAWKGFSQVESGLVRALTGEGAS